MGSETDTIWALKEDTIVELRPRSSRRHQYVPRREFVEGVAANVTQMHVLTSDVILGLEPNGRLHSWSTEGQLSLGWRLPANKRWSGICASTGFLYAISHAHTDESLAVW